ncbi:MAG: hypothetical protein R3C24_14480 [Cyanobacteriota/Melainabacteria group bacterium]|nr:hypothetical protein [Cyanobacteria bacterium HKST-UBA01]MCB9467710.1 hypothetical protein [Candidatus Obscuribacterales bacterium]
MGGDHPGGFQAIQEYFQQKVCRFCSRQFEQEGIELLRQEPGVLVVRVTCNSCGHPLGVAIVGTTPKPEKSKPRSYGEWTKKDRSRLSKMPKITYDDVLTAHQFFQNLGSDWAKYIPGT